MAPAGTPKPIIQKISADVAKIIAMPEVRERILAQASVPMSTTPEAYAAFIQSEIKKWSEVVKLANMQDRLLLRARPTMTLILSAEAADGAPPEAAIRAFLGAAGPVAPWMDRMARVR